MLKNRKRRRHWDVENSKHVYAHCVWKFLKENLYGFIQCISKRRIKIIRCQIHINPGNRLSWNNNARGVRESERERDAFCTIDKKNLCEPRFKLTAIIQLRFYLSRERDWKLKLGDLFPWDLDKGERKVCLNTSKSSIWCFYLKNTFIFITLRLDCNKNWNISLIP